MELSLKAHLPTRKLRHYGIPKTGTNKEARFQALRDMHSEFNDIHFHREAELLFGFNNLDNEIRIDV